MEGSSKWNQAKAIFNAAIEAVQPANLIPHVITLKDGWLQAGEDVFPFDDFDNIYVAGAGKATAAMAYEVEKILSHHIREGVIAVRDSYSFELKYTRAITGGHPLPNANSVIAADEINKLLKKLTSKDLLIFLLSGGASSLMMDIPEKCTIEEVNTVLDALMKSGATIAELNTVRKHLSDLKGGNLVKHCSGATVIAFIISDVVGSDVQVIGSGPTTGDESTFADAIGVLEKYDVKKITPYTVLSHLQHGVDGNIPENPKPGDKLFNRTRNNVIAGNSKALEAAMAKAVALGYNTRIVTNAMTGNAEDVAMVWAETVMDTGSRGTCLLAGGETTVNVRGGGKGGRCQQFALAAAIALKNSSDITLLAAGTDGSDGPTDTAGAIVDSDTWNDARDKGLNAEDYLVDNDAYGFFKQAGGLVQTGPTNTNVMDIVITLI